LPDNHPDFDGTPAGHRWVQSLGELRKELLKGARQHQGKGVWFILPHGALVAMSSREDMRRVLRIARRESPTSDKGWEAWVREVQTFAKHLEVEGWTQTPDSSEGFQKCEVLFTEVYSDEQDEPLCSRCKKAPVADKGKFKEDLCVACAIELGNEEIHQKQLQRQKENAESTARSTPKPKPKKHL